ncbi:Permease of the drug/metabolite transporter (DMT) superfamily [Micromonospora nigra]|uniref:Permease of the drug/metabolite transporter (DMT) superfamily n=1 Tax=Micromonospora nigra TaxID=145857 RepID=A0A1C6R7T2_9ACTN|nr:Permease of the drug/metabolite transporter (DMT) superfamily [Micromonospora nigra]
MKSQAVVGMALCAAAQLMLGASMATTRLLLDYPVFSGQAIRYAIAAVLFLAVICVSGTLGGNGRRTSTPNASLSRAEWAWLAGLSATGLAGYNACLVLALGHADAAVVSTIVGAVPLLVAILVPAIRRKAPSVRLLAAAGIVVAGSTLVHGTGQASALGLIASVGALLGDVAFALIAARLLPRIGPVRLSAYSCVLAVPMLATAALVAGEPASWRLPSLTEWLVLAYLGVALTGVGFWCWFRGIQLATVERGSLTVGLVPLAAVITMTVQDHAAPPVAQMGGIGVVIVGLIVGMSAPLADSLQAHPSRRAFKDTSKAWESDAAGITWPILPAAKPLPSSLAGQARHPRAAADDGVPSADAAAAPVR